MEESRNGLRDSGITAVRSAYRTSDWPAGTDRRACPDGRRDGRQSPTPVREDPYHGRCRPRSGRAWSVDRFAVITFTNKAADELRARLQLALEARHQAASTVEEARIWLGQLERMAGAHIGTIHGFCGAILRDHGCYRLHDRQGAAVLGRVRRRTHACHRRCVCGQECRRQQRSRRRNGPILARVEWDAHIMQAHATELVEQCHRVGLEVDDLLTQRRKLKTWIRESRIDSRLQNSSPTQRNAMRSESAKRDGRCARPPPPDSGTPLN